MNAAESAEAEHKTISNTDFFLFRASLQHLLTGQFDTSNRLPVPNAVKESHH